MKLGLVLAVGFAFAATGAAAQGPGLNLAALRDCASQTIAAEQRRSGLEALAVARAEIARAAAATAAERSGVDAYDPIAVADFNERVARGCADYAAYVAAFNAVIAAENIHAAVFNSSCADRSTDAVTIARLPADLRTAWHRATGSGEEMAMLSDATVRR